MHHPARFTIFSIHCGIRRSRLSSPSEVVLSEYSLYVLIGITAVSFIAYVLKAATGFGTAIVIVSLGSLLIGTVEAVIVCAIIDVIGGTILYIRDPVAEDRPYWVPMTAAMIAGAIAGAWFLKYFSGDSFDVMLGVVISILGVWFLVGRDDHPDSGLLDALPNGCSKADLGVSTFSGICSGLFAVGGPPIVFWLGRTFTKHSFRRSLIVMFYFSTIARLTIYGATGLLDRGMIMPGLFSLPGIVLGIIVGNRIFIALSERAFSRLIGGVLIFVGIRLLLK